MQKHNQHLSERERQLKRARESTPRMSNPYAAALRPSAAKSNVLALSPAPSAQARQLQPAQPPPQKSKRVHFDTREAGL